MEKVFKFLSNPSVYGSLFGGICGAGVACSLAGEFEKPVTKYIRAGAGIGMLVGSSSACIIELANINAKRY